jgi:hypothetical protein
MFYTLEMMLLESLFLEKKIIARHTEMINQKTMN